MKLVERFLSDAIGLDSASIGSSLIYRTVRLRMRKQGVKSEDEYLKLLRTSTKELDELIEAVVVTETWFFRDREAFTALVQLVRDEWLPSHPFSVLRLLSAPCSSGEEAYSLAMALLDAGVPAERFQIDAVDISSRVLARARRAVYGRNSFRGKDLAFRSRYFQSTKDGYALHPAVRSRVSFQKANLLRDGWVSGVGSYDFIFFRNLLIYFDTPTQRRAVDKLERLLSPEGYFFVGPAELPLVMNNGFVSMNLPMAFACRKAGAVVPPSAPRRQRPAKSSVPQEPPGPPTISPQVASRQRNPKARENMVQRVASKPGAARVDLEAARQLADEGRLAEATAICEAHLEKRGPSAFAYYLLGLVRDAAGDARAIEFYRKAVYLEPDHYEALLQMALLHEKNGDTASARILHKRAHRAAKTSLNRSPP